MLASKVSGLGSISAIKIKEIFFLAGLTLAKYFIGRLNNLLIGGINFNWAHSARYWYYILGRFHQHFTEAFTCADPKSAKNTEGLTDLLRFWDVSV